MPHAFRMILVRLCVALAGSGALQAQWTPVPTVSFSTLSLSQFADHEIEVPYYLFHFAQVANAVVETGDNRGFLDIKVNREPVDNQPYNARIMEMQMALAYFYGADRPWNTTYRGHPAVRARLEAMLDRWARIQNQPGSADGDFDGLFSEYSASNWSLAPTGFGSMAAAQALEIIVTSGQPFDPVILDKARVALRAALMAMFTRSDMTSAARQYSNQFSGSYYAALTYLSLWPDASLESTLASAVAAHSTNDQSPAGYHYEQGGPDFGYSNVHETNLRVALPRLRLPSNTSLLDTLRAADTRWNDWLAVNNVPQPGSSPLLYLANAGLNTRTSTNTSNPETRPYSEWVISSRPFALTDTEFASAVSSRRAQVQSQFGTWGALSVPSAYSYIPAFVYDAWRPLDSFQPTASQRTAAYNQLPYVASSRFNRQHHDPLPMTVTSARRPGYYAVMSSGKIRVTRQNYGLGLVWNPVYGAALQTVAGTTWNWGTKAAGATSFYEQADFYPSLTAGGASTGTVSGIRELPSGDLVFTYPLGSAGTKSVTFAEGGIDVSVTHTGSFSESLPLLNPTDATFTNNGTRLSFSRPNGSSLSVSLLTPGATFSIGSASTLATGLERRIITINASGPLRYLITPASTPLAPGSLGAPASESCTPANAAADNGETVTFNLPLVNLSAFSVANVTAVLEPTPGVLPTTLEASYGTLAAGATVARPFTFTVVGTCGSQVPLTLSLYDGANSLGTVLFLVPIGSLTSTTTVLQNFEGATPPALPAGWTSTIVSGAATAWSTQNGTQSGETRGAASAPVSTTAESRLDSPAFSVPSGVSNIQLRFQNRWNTESGYDGGVLEVSRNGGAFSDVVSAGGSFLSGGYVGTISSGYSSPIGGRSAWSGSGSATTVVSLPASFAGSTIALRFRLASDSSVNVSNPIWRIDTLELTHDALLCQSCGTPPAFTSAAPAGPLVVGRPFTHAYAVAGTPAPTLSIASGALPAGIILTPSGMLSGVPLAPPSAAPSTFTLRASNGMGPDALQSGSLAVVTRLEDHLAALGVAEAERAPDADPDGDGLGNRLEYATGTHPGQPGAPAIRVDDVTVGQARHLRLRFNRSLLATDVVYIVEASEDLSTWQEIARSTGGGPATGTAILLETGTGLTRTVEATDPQPVPASGMRMLRLRAEAP